jgi:hypothetical protein
MNRFIQRIMATFVGLFVLSVVGITVYAIYWQDPAQRCEQHGDWWDGADRVCAKPIFLPNITHRPLVPRPSGAGAAGATRPLAAP